MTAEETRKYDPDDNELKAVMGSRFHDRSGEAVSPQTTKASSDTSIPGKAAQNEAYTVRNAECSAESSWVPEKPAPNFFDNLKASARSALTFGGLNILIFYWEQIGLMDASIAVPSMCVCAALAGWGVGKVFARECRR